MTVRICLVIRATFAAVEALYMVTRLFSEKVAETFHLDTCVDAIARLQSYLDADREATAGLRPAGHLATALLAHTVNDWASADSQYAAAAQPESGLGTILHDSP